MSKPSIPDFSGISAMTDTLDFVKNLWGGMNIPGMGGMGIPGMIMPTLSVEEINKQISDLKAVESWLTLNMNMLRSTIQALEVQSATITALKSMSATFNAAVQPNPADSATEKKAASPVAPNAEKKVDAPAASSHESKAAPNTDAAKAATQAQAGGNTAQLANPAIWWNMLQDQFNQAVTTAMASEKAKPVAKAANVESKAKAAAKKTPAPRQRKASKPKES